jgi:hypothetical protein
MGVGNTNNPHISSRYEQWLEARADGRTREMLREFTLALQSGAIDISGAVEDPPIFAGGVNYCPNSDFKFSTLAIETPGSLPGDAGDDNQECYQFYRQEQGDDLTLDAAHALKAVGHSLFAANEGANTAIPIWDRENGWLTWGADAAPLWDVAVNFYNNDIKPADTWYIRFVLGALSADLVPEDLEMYCGFWHKTATGEGWIEGGNLTLTNSLIGLAGTQEFNYMVVAETDGGATLYSQILNVSDAPDVLSDTNMVRVSYAAAVNGGFVKFTIYRETVATGAFHQIGLVRNTNELVFDDDGDTIMPVNGFPTGAAVSQALAYSRRLVVGASGAAVLLNDFKIEIPTDYNWSETLAFSQFFRFGFTLPTAINRQISLDRIYLGPSFNKWSDSPFDSKAAIPSTSQTGAPPVGGDTGGPPGCIRFDVPVLRLDFDEQYEWLPYDEVPDGDLLESGEPERNVIKQKQPTKAKQFYRVDFSNKSWIYCTRPHHLRLNKEGDSKAMLRLPIGATVWGWTDGVEGPVTITGKLPISVEKEESFGTFALAGEKADGNHFYVAGFSESGKDGVFNKNRKQI